MNFILTNTDFLESGIFGKLVSEDGLTTFETLQHAYPIIPVDSTETVWTPKVAVGTYSCIRHSPHRLPYTTFMLQNVPDFQGQPVSGILIHVLNFDSESEGCIGIGLGRDGNIAIIHSKDAFNKFMDLQIGIEQFNLIIC